MKNTNTKKRRLATGMLAALTAVSVLTVPTSASNAAAPQILTSNTAITASVSGTATKSARYYKQMERFQKMQQQDHKINVALKHKGYYVKNNAKLYGKKVIGVKDNGDFILGNWECLNTQTNVWKLMNPKTFKISGTYVAFAYSFDIVGGTDFPYSGVFWNHPENEMRELVITTSGGCRTADIHIYYEYGVPSNNYCSTRIGSVIETNCSSHKEWKP